MSSPLVPCWRLLVDRVLVDGFVVGIFMLVLARMSLYNGDVAFLFQGEVKILTGGN